MLLSVIQTNKKRMNCEECEAAPAQRHCSDCGQSLCRECDSSLHKKGKRREHKREDLVGSGSREKLGENCATKELLFVSIYWEVSPTHLKAPAEAKSILSAICQAYGAIHELRVYVPSGCTGTEEWRGLGGEVVGREGVAEYQSLLMDVSLKSRGEDYGTLLILSANPTRLKPFLCGLTHNPAKGCILLSTSLNPLTFHPPEMIQQQSPPSGPRLKPASHDFKAAPKPSPRPESRESIAIFQRWNRKLFTEGIEGRLLDFLKSYANQGKIMSEVIALVSGFQHYAIVKAEIARNAVQTVLSADLIHITNRSFGTLKTLNFISLKVDSLSLELLLWTLRSLKNDEMLPTERAIQSRMKEAFDYKPAQTQWQMMVDMVMERSKHQHSYSAPDINHIIKHPSLASVSVPVSTIPNFIVKDVIDPLTNLETKVVFPEGEEWVALDSHMKAGDMLKVKETEHWKSFISFLESYFQPTDDPKRAWRRSEEDHAISGGRYGCAQFLKFCGPAILQSCSLGKLSYMVQLAINEDLLRYQKTLLMWTPASFKSPDQSLISEKLTQVQQAVIQALKETPEGISLAQLPMQVRRLLPFPLDMAELGFAKLKDLLGTISTVKVELRGSNHPFATLVALETPDLPALLAALHSLLSEYTRPMPAHLLESALTSRFSQAISWTNFECESLVEFLQKWGGSMFEVTHIGETRVGLRPDPWRRTMTAEEASGSMFYSELQGGKVVTVSDLPEEFQLLEKEEEQRRYVEELVGEDVHIRMRNMDVRSRINFPNSQVPTHPQSTQDSFPY